MGGSTGIYTYINGDERDAGLCSAVSGADLFSSSRADLNTSTLMFALSIVHNIAAHFACESVHAKRNVNQRKATLCMSMIPT